MPDNLGRPTLAEHLAAEQLTKIVQKKLFAGYQVPAYQFLEIGLWIFGQGGVLGRARSNRLEVMAKMFIRHEALHILFAPMDLPKEVTDDAQWVFEALRKVGSDGLRYYRDSQRKEPDLLMDLWLTAFAPPEVDFRDPNKLRELANKKLPLDQAVQRLDYWLFSGISFGANHPTLLESIWKRSYELADREEWAQARKAGLDIPEEPSPVPLHDMETLVLENVAFYVRKYFQELIDPLNLRLS